MKIQIPAVSALADTKQEDQQADYSYNNMQ